MWKDSEGSFYFYPKIDKCFNLRSLSCFTVSEKTKINGKLVVSLN